MRSLAEPPPAPLGSAPAVVAVVAAMMIGGIPGAVIVLVAAIDAGTERSRLPGAIALALLLAAALATVLEAPLSPWTVGLDFALDRPVASTAGMFVGVAAVVSLLLAAVEERSPPVIVKRPRRPRRSLLGMVLPHAAAALPGAVAGTVVGICSALWPGSALPPALAMSVANLRGGTLDDLATAAPLAPLAIVVLPGDGRWATVIVRTLAVLAVLRLVGRFTRTPLPISAGLAVATVVSLFDEGIAGTLALLLVSVAALWAWPTAVTPLRAGVAGLFLAAAALSRAEAILVLPILAACLVRKSGRRRGSALSLVAATSAAVSLSLVGLDGRIGRWWAGAYMATSWRWWAPLLAAVLVGAVLSRAGLGQRMPATATSESLRDQGHDEGASTDGNCCQKCQSHSPS